MRTEIEKRIEELIDEMVNVRVLKPILDTERMPFNEYSEDAIIHFYTYINMEEKDYYVVFRNDKTYVGMIQKTLIKHWQDIKGKFELLSECDDYICGQPGIHGLYNADLHGIAVHFYKTDQEGRRERIGWAF
ncbi:MAG: hypothetical protein C0177_06440, partial [Fervidicoccus fontis]